MSAIADLLDVNVWLALTFDSHIHHPAAKSWFDGLSNNSICCFCRLTQQGFLRLATNSKVFPKPLSVDEALEHVDTWLAHPNTKIVAETDEHWRILRDLLQATGAAGNLTSDAHLAALALEYGAVLSSCDADFSRFPNLRWQNPL